MWLHCDQQETSACQSIFPSIQTKQESDQPCCHKRANLPQEQCHQPGNKAQAKAVSNPAILDVSPIQTPSAVQRKHDQQQVQQQPDKPGGGVAHSAEGQHQEQCPRRVEHHQRRFTLQANRLLKRHHQFRRVRIFPAQSKRLAAQYSTKSSTGIGALADQATKTITTKIRKAILSQDVYLRFASRCYPQRQNVKRVNFVRHYSRKEPILSAYPHPTSPLLILDPEIGREAAAVQFSTAAESPPELLSERAAVALECCRMP